MRRLPVIEVDLLLAYLVAEDRHHNVASTYFSKVAAGSLARPSVTPFALQELELGVRAKIILPQGRPANTENDLARFMSELCEALETHGMKIQSPPCATFSKAASFRETYDLTYYDSLHASSAFFHDREIISTDRDYDRIKELRRTDPYKL